MLPLSITATEVRSLAAMAQPLPAVQVERKPLVAQFETDLQSASPVRVNRHQTFLRRLGDALARLFSPLL